MGRQQYFDLAIKEQIVMTKARMLVLLMILICLGTIPAMADSATFTLVDPTLTTTPGSTVTWQYDVTNNSGDTILGLSVNSDLFQNGTPDASVFDGFGAGIPDGASMIGSLFSFTADPTVLNSVNSGTFDLTILLGDGSIVDLFAPYSVTVAPAVNVPEPAMNAMLLVTMLVLSIPFLRKWKQQQAC